MISKRTNRATPSPPYCLILHGPVLSVGKSGEYAHISKSELGTEHVESYDVTKRFDNNIWQNNNKDLYYKILVTREISEEQRSSLSPWLDEIISIPSSTEQNENNSTPWTNNNKNKMYQLVHEGLLASQRTKLSFEKYLIARADQLIPVDQAFRELDNGKKFLFFNMSPFYVYAQDFIIGATSSSVQHLLDATRPSEHEYSTNIHIDLPLKLSDYNDVRNFLKRHVIDSASDPKIFTKYENTRAQSTTITKDTASSISWRGSHLSEEFLEFEYHCLHHVTSKTPAIKALKVLNFDYATYAPSVFGKILLKIALFLRKKLLNAPW